MLSVKLYKSTNDVYDLKFIENHGVPTVVVCPNPLIADEFGTRAFGDNSLRIVTISKFMSDKLKIGFDDLKIFKKSEYLAHLGTVYKKVILDGTSDGFFQAFNLFTELRSFSLDFDYISEILKSFDQNVAKAVKYFWHYTDHLDLVDEHRAYRLLSVAYREIDHEVHANSKFINPCENIVFWGFSHLNAGQVDLLKALSIYHDVFVPFPETVYSLSQMSDWINWLSPNDIEEGYVDATKIDSINVVRFPKKRLSETLKNYSEKIKVPNDVFLATKNPCAYHFIEVLSTSLDFKAECDLFSDIYNLVSDNVKKIIKDTDDVDKVIDAIKGSIRQAIIEKKFRAIKVWSLLLKEVKSWRELSDANQIISSFDLDLILYAVNLNLPRVFSRPVYSDDFAGNIRGFEGLTCFKEDNVTFVCVTSDYPSIRNVSEKYNEEVLTFLASTGPIRRGEFEFQLLKFSLLEIFKSPNTILFLENGINESDLAWDDILSHVENFNEIEVENERSISSDDYLKTLIVKKEREDQKISASRLQLFMDCKRKYYFDNIERLDIKSSKFETLEPNQLGILEHDVIDKYLNGNSEWDEDVHTELVKASLDQFLLNEGIVTSEIHYIEYLEEIINFSRNGIKVLLKIRKYLPGVNFEFESSLTAQSDIRGSIDCVVKSEDMFGIIDFKRSSGSIPSQTEFKNFDKIQLWFYLNHYNVELENLLFIGYLNLSEIEKSLFFSEDENVISIFKDQQILDGAKINSLKTPLKEMIDEYRNLEVTQIQNLKNEIAFPPSPRNESICTFCTVLNLCPRGE